MARHSIPRKEVLEVIQWFHWFYKKDLVDWFPEYESRIDSLLREFLGKEKVRATRYGIPKVYASAQRTKDGLIDKTLIPHGLACSYILKRVVTEHSDRKNLKIIPEKKFSGFKRKPEWGILSPAGTLLMLEYCTRDNFKRKWNMDGKVITYSKIDHNICRKVGAKEAVVLFVCDVPREAVWEYVGSINGMSARSASLRPIGDRFPLHPFLFTDYETFKIRTHEKIYIWAKDSTEHELI